MNALRKALVAISVSLVVLTAAPVLAQNLGSDILGQVGQEAGYASDSEVSGDQLPVLIGNIIRVLLGLVGIVFLILMVYGGYLWMTARGDSKIVDKAKEIIKQAVIGAIIVMLAYAITGFVVGSIGAASSESSGNGSCNAGAACQADADCHGGACGGNQCICPL